KDVVIVDDAVLKDFDEARAPVRVRGLEDIGQVLVDVDAPRDEPRARAQREHARSNWPVDRAEGRGWAARADAAGRRILPLRQPIYLVVEEQNLAVEVAAQHVHRVVAADAERIAV